MVQCKACGREFRMITNSHLHKEHAMLPETYLAAYPGAVLCDEAMLVKIKASRHHVVRPLCAKPGCGNPVTQSWNRYCSRTCSMSDRMSKTGRNEQAADANHEFDGGWYSLGKAQKAKARERDGHHCRKCKEPVIGKQAHVHHLIPERCFDTPEEAHALSNLITLCDKCHLTVEWAGIKELYRRAKLLDDVMHNVPSFQTLEQFISVQVS